MQLPAHVQTAVGVDAEITEEELAVAVEANGFSQTVFGLTGQEFATTAIAATGAHIRYEVMSAGRPLRVWKYMEFSNGGSIECSAVYTPESGTGHPVTAAGQVLAAAWFSDHSVIDGDTVRPQLLVSGYAATGVQDGFARRLTKAWAEACSLMEGATVPPIWVSKSQLGIGADARVISTRNSTLRFSELFLEAISEVKTKWRFLSIYRILEHGYLSELFQIIEAEFFSSPRESLSTALTSLDSELNQFISLVESTSLKSQFEGFHDEFERVKANNNRFAAAIDRSIAKGGQLKSLKDKWQKGVLIYYKIRCSIVHAGVASPIFDAYPDSTGCLEELLPTCEALILQFLGVSTA